MTITLGGKLRGVILATALLTPACAHIQLVADYDAASVEETIRVGKRVDLFYGTVLELDAASRAYAPFADQYVDIEADIRSLVRRNAARPLNSESTQISETILSFWIAYHDKHKTKNAYPDARLDRLRFDRLFNAALSAEVAKKLGAADRAPPPEPEPDPTLSFRASPVGASRGTLRVPVEGPLPGP